MNDEIRTSKEVSKSSLGLRTKGKDQAEISSQEGVGTLSRQNWKAQIIQLIEENRFYEAAEEYSNFIKVYGEPITAWEVFLHAE